MRDRTSFAVVKNTRLPRKFPAQAVQYLQRQDDRRRELHYHVCLEIGLCDEGGGVQFIGSDIFTFGTGSIALIQKGCIHDSHILPVGQSGESRWRYIFADTEFFGAALPKESFTVYDPELKALFEMMYRELNEPREDSGELFGLLLRAFLCKVRRSEPELRPMKRAPEQMAAAVSHIAQHYREDLTVEGLARICSLSAEYFRRAFRESFGVGPQQYIISLRLRIAAQLLKTTDRPVLEVAEESGFHSLSSFNRLFRRQYGCTPREMRG